MSDSHHAGQAAGGLTPQAPIGTATTVVYADRLSERGISDAVKGGHTYVKLTGNAGPDVRLTGKTRRHRHAAIFGDTLRGDAATFVARVIGGHLEDPAGNGPVDLLIVKDGVPFQTEPVTSDDFTLPFTVTEHGRYRLQVQQGALPADDLEPDLLRAAPPAARQRLPRRGRRARPRALARLRVTEELSEESFQQRETPPAICRRRCPPLLLKSLSRLVPVTHFVLPADPDFEVQVQAL